MTSPGGQPGPKQGPRVVMMAGNNISGDARVLKAATTVTQFGVDVVAVGLNRGRGGDQRTHPFPVTRVTVPAKAAVSGPRARGRRLFSALAPWFVDQADYRAALGRWEQKTRELSADRGRSVRDAARHGEGPTQVSAVDRVSRAVRWRSLRLRRKVLAARALPLKRKAWVRAPGDDRGVGRAREAALRAYRRAPLLGQWRTVLPEIIDQDLAIGPVVDALEPDVIHVHDVFFLGIAARSAQRAALAGRTVRLIYDAHEYLPGLAMVPPQVVAAYCDLESEFMPDVDRVVTVSPPLAHLLQADHGLERLPDVVLNAPVADDGSREVVGVREVCGLADDVPLLVYGGGVHAARGVHTVVDALEQLPGVHLVVVVRQANAVTKDLEARAARIGAADRLHFAPFVDPELVPRYLSSASVGVSPLLHSINHDVAITNKFCEYLNGGLPIVTSDTPAQADLVEELGLGAVHRADDPADFAVAVREVLADLPRLRERIAGDEELRHRFSWSAQAEVLRGVYDEVLGGLPAQAWEPGATEVRRLTLS